MPNSRPVAGAPKARILIVEDHPIVREHLAALINHQKKLRVCGEAEDADSALKAIAESQPNLVTVDLGLRGRNGLELIKEIHQRHSTLPVLVLSMHEEQIYVERALKAGARGYITKREATQRIIPAIEKVLAGQVYLNDAMSSLLIKKLIADPAKVAVASPLKQLTDREFDVLRLIGLGQSTRTIAKSLAVAITTVETYRSRLREKLELKDGSALVHYAIRTLNKAQQP